MVFVILIGLLLGTRVHGTSMDNWACNFVGLRLGKTQSRCESGVCTGISGFVDSELFFPNFFEGDALIISCHRAQELATEIVSLIASSRSEAPGYELRSEISDHLNRFLQGGDYIEEEIRNVFQTFDAIIARQVLHYSPESLEMDSNLSSLVRSIIKRSWSVPHSIDSYGTDGGLAVYQFVIDLISWYSISDYSSELLPILLSTFIGAHKIKPAYPHEGRWEGRDDISLIESMSITQYIDLVDDLGAQASQLRKNPNGDYQFETPRFFALLTTCWNPNLDNAVTNLLTAHIQNSDICLNISRIPLVVADWTPLWHKAVLTLMHICNVGEDRNIASILTAGVKLERIRLGMDASPDEISAPMVDPFVTYFLRNPSSWLPGWKLTGHNGQYALRFLREVKRRTDVISKKGDFNSIRSAYAARNLGRGMGMVLLAFPDIFRVRFGRILGLKSEYVDMIHSPGTKISKVDREITHYIREGFRDAIGGLGVGTFSKFEWGFLFGDF